MCDSTVAASTCNNVAFADSCGNTGACVGTLSCAPSPSPSPSASPSASPIILVSPTPFTGTPLSTVSEIVGGRNSSSNTGHICARTSAGGIYCWGTNADIVPGAPTAKAIQIVPSGATQLIRGQTYLCYIASSGSLYCWGNNVLGQLGTGDTTTYTTPQLVNGLGGTVTTAAAGDAGHTCAIINTSPTTMKCWGSNANGQLGNGDQVMHTTPQTVVADATLTPFTGATKVAAGDNHTCAIKGGDVYCWGSNRNDAGSLYTGQIAQPNTVSYKLYPTLVAGLTTATVKAVSVTASFDSTCAILSDQSFWCWGNLRGTTPTFSPVQPNTSAISDLSKVLQVDIGISDATICALSSTKVIYCTGDNTYGQLGRGTYGDGNHSDWAAIMLTNLPAGAGSPTAVTSQLNGNCGAFTNGQAFCWGSNINMLLGYSPAAIQPANLTPYPWQPVLQ